MQEVGVGARLTMAVTAPFVYLARTMFPLRLSPLNPLPIEPTIDWGTGSGLVAQDSPQSPVVVWRMRRKRPGLVVATVAHCFSLAPVVGLTPTGLQATADRYMYVPGIVSIAARRRRGCRSVAAHAPGRRLFHSSRLAALVIALCVLTWQQTRWWHDSVALWTRVAELDPRNDIATYNLAIALADAGDAEAIARYEQTLRIVPDQALAPRESAGASSETIRARRRSAGGCRTAG